MDDFRYAISKRLQKFLTKFDIQFIPMLRDRDRELKAIAIIVTYLLLKYPDLENLMEVKMPDLRHRCIARTMYETSRSNHQNIRCV